MGRPWNLLALIFFASFSACRPRVTKGLESRTDRVRVSQIESSDPSREDLHFRANFLRFVAVAGGVEVYWSLEYGCGVKPDPRTTVEGTRIAIDPNVHVTGHRCPPMLVLFRTQILGLAPGPYEVAVGEHRSSVDVLPRDHGWRRNTLKGKLVLRGSGIPSPRTTLL
jgi:hypothetical protein